MKAIYLHAAGAIALTFGLAACVPQATPPAPTPPPPVQRPAPTPTPTPTPVVQQPTYDNYLDAPQTEGDWSYVSEPGESLGIFGIGNAAPPFIIRCNKATGEIGIARRTDRAGPLQMRVRTETTSRQLTANSVPGSGIVAAVLNARDPLLDAMAITKGRFAVELEGERTLYLPAWVEVSRVIEDCR